MIRLIQINNQVHEFDELKDSKILDIRNILNPNGNNSIRVVGKGTIRMNIKCFVYNPPPPEFKECPECGKLNFNSNETTGFLRDMIGIRKRTDRLYLNITDEDNDLVRVRLTIPRINLR